MHAIIKVRVMITRSITNCGRSSLITRTTYILMAAKKKAAKKKTAKKATKKVAKKKASKKKR